MEEVASSKGEPCGTWCVLAGGGGVVRALTGSPFICREHVCVCVCFVCVCLYVSVCTYVSIYLCVSVCICERVSLCAPYRFQAEDSMMNCTFRKSALWGELK